MWKKTCVDKFININYLLVQSDGETYCCCENLFAHMIEITGIYAYIYDNFFLVYLIRKERFSVGKSKSL